MNIWPLNTTIDQSESCIPERRVISFKKLNVKRWSLGLLTGQWLQPFNVTFTQEERFYVNKYKIVQVPMMLRSGKYYLAYDPTLKVGILKLPCEEGIAMLVLLPDEDVDYTYVDESMTGQVFRGWVEKLKKTWVM